MKIMGLSLAKTVIKIFYFFMKLLPTFNKVVLISRFNRKTSIDFKLIKEEILTNHKKTRVVILNHKLKNKFLLIFDVLIEMYHLATSKAVIIDSYIIPISILNHKKKLIIIQIWHALGAIKKFGKACLDTKEGASSKMAKILKMHENYTYIIASGNKTIENYNKCFCSKKTRILPYGMPRIDYLTNKAMIRKKKNEIFNRYPGLKEKKNIFYFPTFRKGKDIPYDDVIKQVDLNKYNLIIVQHQNDKTKILDKPNIYLLKNYPVMDILTVTDYFISDYSASFFEAALLNIPFHCYDFDYARYQINRGLFMNLKEEIPGVVSSNMKDIMNGIENNINDLEKYEKFKKNYVCARNCTKKIVSLLEL